MDAWTFNLLNVRILRKAVHIWGTSVVFATRSIGGTKHTLSPPIRKVYRGTAASTPTPGPVQEHSVRLTLVIPRHMFLEGRTRTRTPSAAEHRVWNNRTICRRTSDSRTCHSAVSDSRWGRCYLVSGTEIPRNCALAVLLLTYLLTYVFTYFDVTQSSLRATPMALGVWCVACIASMTQAEQFRRRPIH